MPLPPGFIEDPQPVQPQSAGKPPAGFTEIGDATPDSNFGDVVKSALNEARMGNGSKMRALMTDPVTQAKVLPYLAGTAGGFGLAGGSALNTAMGHGISDLALKAYGKEDEIPSALSQAGDVALGALGDMGASSIASKQIGKAMKNAGVVTRAPLKLPTASTVGTTLDELETTLKQALKTGKPLGPQSAKDAYAIADFVAGNPNIVGKSNDIAVQAARTRALASAALNQAVPERIAPAARMTTANTIPNAIRDTYNKLPGNVRSGIGFGAGATGTGGLLYELGKKLFTGG